MGPFVDEVLLDVVEGGLLGEDGLADRLQKKRLDQGERRRRGGPREAKKRW